jgi:hypothetical protein
MPTRADDLGQVDPLIHPTRVGRAAGIAQQQRPGRTISQRVLFGYLVRHCAAHLQADVAVGVDQSRHQPDVGGQCLRVLRWLGTDATVHDPEIRSLAGRQDDAVEMQPVSAPCAGRRAASRACRRTVRRAHFTTRALFAEPAAQLRR